jgi:diguanylate cyclase (GGDEF)-like protein
MVPLEWPLWGNDTMTGLLCYSSAAENNAGTIPAEKPMMENGVLPLPSSMNCFFEMLEYEFHRAVRYKNAVTLMFIKLCRLEELADICGQLNAERIITEIERIIRSNIRFSDRGFMYGKDEYMIILPQTTKNNADHMIPKLQSIIENYRFSNERGMTFNLTPKFGIVSFPFSEESIENQIKAVEKTSLINGNSVIPVFK